MNNKLFKVKKLKMSCAKNLEAYKRIVRVKYLFLKNVETLTLNEASYALRASAIEDVGEQ